MTPHLPSCCYLNIIITFCIQCIPEWCIHAYTDSKLQVYQLFWDTRYKLFLKPCSVDRLLGEWKLPLTVIHWRNILCWFWYHVQFVGCDIYLSKCNLIYVKRVPINNRCWFDIIFSFRCNTVDGIHFNMVKFFPVIRKTHQQNLYHKYNHLLKTKLFSF